MKNLSVLHDTLAYSRGAFAKVLAKAAHATAECRTGVQRPSMFHVFAKTPASVTNT